ncbi:hypothetical protein ACFX15_010199 [Malus domestica]
MKNLSPICFSQLVSFTHRQQDRVPAFHTPNPSPSTQVQKAKKDNDDQKPMSELRNQNWIPMIYFLNTFISQR